MAMIDLATESDIGHRLYEAWRYAKAKWEMVDYAPDRPRLGVPHDISAVHCGVTCDALNTYLLHPAADLRALALKLRVFRDEEIWDNWRCGEEITAVLAKDAHRLAYGHSEGV